jgi:phosphate uptake regulator
VLKNGDYRDQVKERVADHATNVAEDVIFMVEAKDVRHHRVE